MTPDPEADHEAERERTVAVRDRALEVLRDTEGAPSVLAQARGELLALKSGAQFCCTRPDGSIRPALASGEGFYAADTRHLSELRLTIAGRQPVLLSSAIESGHHAFINATNPMLTDGSSRLPQDTLSLRQTVLVSECLYYEVAVRNFHREAVVTQVEVSLAADFADVFEVRGVDRRTSGSLAPPTREDDLLRFTYLAVDGQRRETLVELHPSPRSVQIDGDTVHVVWAVELAAGAEIDLGLTAVPIVGGGRPARPGAAAGTEPTAQAIAEALAAQDDAWTSACARISSDNELFDALIDASVRDLHALMMPVGDSELPAAGIPWYVAPFGRDSLLSSCEALMINPAVARGTLLALAGLQADADEDWRDAEPGKILHELRVGELARTGQIPHTPYYGTADATPLFLMVAGGYYRWTLDLDTMKRLRPALDAALEWIDKWGDRDGDGFVEYERRSPAGLRNQGWKDSDDAIMHADGSLAEGPIALVEVQGYVYEAKRRIADVYEALGEGGRAGALRGEAAVLRSAFNEAFWMPEEGFFALALDGAKQQVRSITSNPAHCLYCGIVDDEKARLVGERLMAGDMFSGWGIRTLSSLSPAYNPMSYHNGSVWPHDNAIAAAGLKRYGFDAATSRIAAALFDVASGARDARLPELFCGFSRSESSSIVAYPVACIPQAWAAAAPFMLVQALLGISAHAPENWLIVDRPRLPDWLGSVELRDIRVGEARVSLAFNYSASGATGFTLLEQQGDLRVTMSA
jgi:glycogen debranching enzyme